MAFWREVEQAMATRPAYEQYASSVSAPFLRGEVAEYLSGVLVPDVLRQAIEAKRLGQPEFRPVVTGPFDILRESADHIHRRGRWMDETVSLEVAGVDPLEPELVGLRKRVVRSIEQAIAEATERSQARTAS
jgi:hypothetical protein